MAWKNIVTDTSYGACYASHDLVLTKYLASIMVEGTDKRVADFLRGKTIRVTVEEEVSECCEQWRGMKILGASSLSVRSDPIWRINSKIVFCPGCGKKL